MIEKIIKIIIAIILGIQALALIIAILWLIIGVVSQAITQL